MENQPLAKKLKSWAPTLILVGLIGWLWVRPPAVVTEENRAAAPFSVMLPDGRVVSRDDLKGKVVLINFWATWCPYCRKEMPTIDEFYADHRARGFEVLAVSVDDPAEKIAGFMRDQGYRFAAAPSNDSVRAAFGPVSKLPTSFVMDAEGVIRSRVAGQVHYGRLEDLVLPLLAP
jgi:thiol-disulfide isomerase/thioredoxin